jgi:RNA polymerase sigma-70 factor, ECF subfamily
MAGVVEGEVLKRAKAGDRAAFEVLVGPLIDQGFRLAFGMLHDREAAEDVVQEATVRSWRKLGNLRAGTPMRPWYLAIVANQCRSVFRSRWWSVILAETVAGRSRDEFEDRIARGADLRAALRRLAPEQRLVLVLRYYLDLSLDEVAATAGIPVGTAKSRINRGLAAMRPHFEPGRALING